MPSQACDMESNMGASELPLLSAGPSAGLNIGLGPPGTFHCGGGISTITAAPPRPPRGRRRQREASDAAAGSLGGAPASRKICDFRDFLLQKKKDIKFLDFWTFLEVIFLRVSDEMKNK